MCLYLSGLISDESMVARKDRSVMGVTISLGATGRYSRIAMEQRTTRE